VFIVDSTLQSGALRSRLSLLRNRRDSKRDFDAGVAGE
jgi:hypothetical protein